MATAAAIVYAKRRIARQFLLLLLLFLNTFPVSYSATLKPIVVAVITITTMRVILLTIIEMTPAVVVSMAQ